MFDMTNSFNNFYQYDSCIARGICSINPKTSSLLKVVIIYLKLGAYYGLKLAENGKHNQKLRNLILNTLSVIVSNPDVSENNFNMIATSFQEELPKIIQENAELSEKDNIVPEFLKTSINLNEPQSIIESIRHGEKEYLQEVKSKPAQILDLYNILFVLAKSICINTLYSESYGKDCNEGYEAVLKILDSLKDDDSEIGTLKTLITESARIDNSLMKNLQIAQKERYGEQQEAVVSYSTSKGKAVLVVGSNIRELEYICESLKNENIDIYTHDDMILAHTFPYFQQYPNLKGQFGQGMESCLLDFSTFPGPIILTKHSLYNVENLYRGLLYTTDFAYSKGVIPLKNGDLTPVIESALKSKGFKTGRTCNTEKIGFNKNNIQEVIKEKILSKKYTKIIVFGILGFSGQEQEYFKQIKKIIPEEYLFISAPCCETKDNIIHLNTISDGYISTQILEYLTEITNIPIIAFYPKCDRHTISQILNFVNNDKIQIFLGKCSPLVLNPALIDTFTTMFGVNKMSTPKKDLKNFM